MPLTRWTLAQTSQVLLLSLAEDFRGCPTPSGEYRALDQRDRHRENIPPYLERCTVDRWELPSGLVAVSKGVPALGGMYPYRLQ